MRSWAFLISRRWAWFALAVVLVSWATWWLGEWQFHRLEDRKARNAIVVQNEARAPAPVDEVLAPGRAVAAQDEWRVITASGRYDPEGTVLVRYRTRDGAAGVEVVVPFLTDQGPALVVNRGWLATGTSAADEIRVPAPPAGQVTLTGWVRADATGDSARVVDQATRAVSSGQIGQALGLETYGGFVELRTEDPAPAEPLARAELPELGNGPHFFYGLQWWFFGLLAVVGFGYLVYDEWRSQSPTPVRRGQPRS